MIKKSAESLRPITKTLEGAENSTTKKEQVNSRTSETATKNTKHPLQNSQSQTLQLVSASDQLVRIFSEMNDKRKYIKVIRDPEGNFLWKVYTIIPFGRNTVKINGEDYDLTTEIQTAFTNTKFNFNGDDMDNESIITIDQNLEKFNNDSLEDSNSKGNKSIKKDL